MDIQSALQDYKDYGNDVVTSGYQNFDNNLRRFMMLFDATEPLGELAAEVLPEVDFESWYAQAEKTGGSMYGSGILDWPLPRREKVALQLALLKKIASGALNIYTFCNRFCYANNYLDANINKFIQQVFLPFHRDFIRTLQAATPRREEQPVDISDTPNLIDEERLDQLRHLSRPSFDFSRLIRLCEELNSSYRHHNYHSVALLTRAILDHVPPLFSCKTFVEVANNYSGTRSFKDAMDHLQNSARKIADGHLHTPIRSSEVLPNANQVNFSNNLDVLLSEIIRILK